jgi:hypothetical protein
MFRRAVDLQRMRIDLLTELPHLADMWLMILAASNIRREVPAAGRSQLSHLLEFRGKNRETLPNKLANLADNLQP